MIQGWIAMGSGGWWGQGIATGVAKRGGLPEAHNDFISAVVAEELGVWGWVLLIILYILLLWRAYHISSHANDLYGSLIGTAVTMLESKSSLIYVLWSAGCPLKDLFCHLCRMARLQLLHT